VTIVLTPVCRSGTDISHGPWRTESCIKTSCIHGPPLHQRHSANESLNTVADLMFPLTGRRISTHYSYSYRVLAANTNSESDCDIQLNITEHWGACELSVHSRPFIRHATDCMYLTLIWLSSIDRVRPARLLHGAMGCLLVCWFTLIARGTVDYREAKVTHCKASAVRRHICAVYSVYAATAASASTHAVYSLLLKNPRPFQWHAFSL